MSTCLPVFRLATIRRAGYGDPPFLNFDHGFDADQSDGMVEKMGQGEGKQNEARDQANSLRSAAPQENVHARFDSEFAVASGICAPILGDRSERAIAFLDRCANS